MITIDYLTYFPLIFIVTPCSAQFTSRLRSSPALGTKTEVTGPLATFVHDEVAVNREIFWCHTA